MRFSDFKREIVRLNVGGTHYEVSRETLERCEGSTLAALVLEPWKEEPSDEETSSINTYDEVVIDRNSPWNLYNKEAFFIDPDDKTIFIDRNGQLFGYVLDYLRTNKVHLPPSVSRAAVKEEFEYYGITADINFNTDKYDFNYFLQMAEEISAEGNQLAAMNAAKKSAQIMKDDHSLKRELVFFAIIEYCKINPTPGNALSIDIPKEYRHYVSSHWVSEDLRKRGFEIHGACYLSPTMTIQRQPTNEKKAWEKGNKNTSRERDHNCNK